tara:strand:+ start:397 stop:864 length:468 start_codon:yes stop_codon:yes gene_type:complete
MYGEAFGHNGFGVWWNPGSWGKGTREGGYCDRVQARYDNEISRVRSGDESRQKKANNYLSRAQREKCPWSRKVTKGKVRKAKAKDAAQEEESRQYQQSQRAFEAQAQAEIDAQRALIAQLQGEGASSFDVKTLIIPVVGIVGLVLIVGMLKRKGA